jgi:DNA polymerase III epsilon subunit-like protein
MEFVLISLDVETTGLSTVRAEITQIGVALERWTIDQGQVLTFPLAPFCSYVKCTQTEEFDEKVIELTGITQATVANASSFAVVIKHMLAHLDLHCGESTRVLATYNGDGYDLPVVAAELARHLGEDAGAFMRKLKLTYNLDLLKCGRRCIDSTLLLRTITGRSSFRLGDVYRSLLGKPLEGAHDALQDANAVLTLLTHDQFRTHIVSDLQTANINECTYLTNPMTVLNGCLERYKTSTRVAHSRVQTIAHMINKKRKRKQASIMP